MHRNPVCLVCSSALLLGLLATAVPTVKAGDPESIDVLGRLPTFENVALSPDGARLAFIRTDGDQRFVGVSAGTADQHTLWVRVSRQELRYLTWIDSDHLLCAASSTIVPIGTVGPRQEWYVATILNVRTGMQIPVSVAVDGVDTLNVIYREPVVRIVDGHARLYAYGLYADGTAFRRALFSVEPETGRATIAARTAAPLVEWVVEDGGEVVAAIEYSADGRRWKLKVAKERSLETTVTGQALFEPPNFLGLTSEPGYAVLEIKEGDAIVKRSVSLSDGLLGAPYGWLAEARGVIHERTSGRITGFTRSGSQTYVFGDLNRQHEWDAIVAAFPQAHVTLASRSDDFRKLVVLVDGGTAGYAYHLVDLVTRRTRELAAVYPDLGERANVRELIYPARDGLPVPSALTEPPGRELKRLPLIVLVHGGPEAEVRAEFAWWPQALALQGYLVLEPNYRGSAVSWEFVQAGFGEWGRKMQTDLSDGVRYLVDNGMADSARVCIVGASYGGYAALAGVTLDAQVYRCAVSVAGIADLPRFLRSLDYKAGRREHLVQRYEDRFMGVNGPNDPLLATISPIAHVAAVKAPVLLIHGKDDTVVPYEQSVVMAEALRRAGKEVDFVTLEQEDHWLSRSANRLQMLKATAAFLERNNPAE